jgi:hypothetical protein
MGQACPGHPRLLLARPEKKDVDARVKPAHDAQLIREITSRWEILRPHAAALLCQNDRRDLPRRLSNQDVAATSLTDDSA